MARRRLGRQTPERRRDGGAVKASKKILGNETVRRFLCWLGARYIRLVLATGRWTMVRGEASIPYIDAGIPFIFCFWHGRILMMPYAWERRDRAHMLISQHRDGQIIARTVEHFGIRTIAGSTQRGGAAALRTMLKVLRAGDCVGITPDGPRGPRMRASDGIVNVARMAGRPIIPMTFGACRRKVVPSWDRFVVPLPFSRGVFVWGDPIEVPRDMDDAAVEAARVKVEESLNAITAEADRLTGHAPIEPDLAAGEVA
jgi:lysophospholipid acyltransferase (LPLAT)-like uncharacterized protein